MVKLYLKNSATNWQSSSIDLNTAFILLSAQTMDQAKNWFVCFEDGADLKVKVGQWINILECEPIIKLFKPSGASFAAPLVAPTVAPVVAPPPPQYNQSNFQSPQIEDQLPQQFFDPTNYDEVTPEPEEVPAASSVERRQHTRYDVRLRVIIKSGQNTFLTYTSDVSLGGLSLVNEVPEHIFNAEAELYITAPDQKNNLKLVFLPIRSPLGRSRLMFTKMEEGRRKILASWLQHIVQPSSKRIA